MKQQITEKNSRIWSRLGQRGTVCGVALLEIMEEYQKSYVVTADLGYLSGLGRVKKEYPKRFINVGIAEQNMIGVAAGLAFEGNVVFATTYATFITMRCYEQIRHNLGYQGANVKLVGSATGLAMGMSGNTHYSYEDISIMRTIPNMTVISPADAAEAYMAIHQVAQDEGAAYIRLSGNMNSPIIYQRNYSFEIGKAITLRQGKDIALIATGGCVSEALEACEWLKEFDIQAKVVNMHTIKPLDTETIDMCLEHDYIFTIEEHNVIGGLGSAVAEYLSQKEYHPKHIKIGIDDKFVHPGEYEYLKKCNRLDANGITKTVLAIVRHT